MSQKGDQSSMEIGTCTSETVLVVDNDPDPSQNVADPSQNESQESPTWSESPDPEGITSAVPLPDALKHLYRNGLRFKKTPEFIWNRETEQPKLVKSCSVYFSVDSICTSQEILEAFDKAGIDIDEISSIQRKASNKSWVVTFDSAVTKEDALEVATIEIGGVPVFLGDCENRVVLVKMYEAPAELPDTALIGRLSYYGRVLSFRRDRIAESIDSGVRTARMRSRSGEHPGDGKRRDLNVTITIGEILTGTDRPEEITGQTKTMITAGRPFRAVSVNINLNDY